MSKLKYLSTSVVDDLTSKIEQNVDRYKQGDFADLANTEGWAIHSKVEFDPQCLKKLSPEGGAEAEIENSLIVWKSLSKLRPCLAGENRIWSRLTHVECFDFVRARWINLDADDEQIVRSIRAHFFSDTWTRCRDDNAVSRLWWNGHIANLACPNNIELGLQTILNKADFRLNFVERARTCARPIVAAAIVRMMNADERITQSERVFREFMKAVNLHGGGIVFEAMARRDVDRFMLDCANIASAAVASG